MKRILDLLSQLDFPLDYTFEYKHSPIPIKISLTQSLSGALNIADEEIIIEAIFNIYNSLIYNHENEFTKKLNESIIHWLYDMGENVAFENSEELSILKVSQENELPINFLNHLLQENYISKKQITCVHRFEDHYDENADFYNFPGFCSKCLLKEKLNLNNSHESGNRINQIYKKWKKSNLKKYDEKI